jgi:hypothetical protein
MIRNMIQTCLCAVALFVAAPAFAGEAKVPTTTEEHFALAKSYQEQAAAHHKEAQEHRDMAAAYKKSGITSNAVAHGQKDPRIDKAVKHCDAIAAAAEKLATEDEKAADFHTLRGKELQGK